MKLGNQKKHGTGSMNGRVIVVGIAVLLAVSGAACGSDDPSNGEMEIAQALVVAEGSIVTITGFLLVDRDGKTRLCSGLLESDPPQCGGDRIDLLGFDASSVPNTSRSQSSSEILTAMWTNSQIAITGTKGSGGLTDVSMK